MKKKWILFTVTMIQTGCYAPEIPLRENKIENPLGGDRGRGTGGPHIPGLRGDDGVRSYQRTTVHSPAITDDSNSRNFYRSEPVGVSVAAHADLDVAKEGDSAAIAAAAHRGPRLDTASTGGQMTDRQLVLKYIKSEMKTVSDVIADLQKRGQDMIKDVTFNDAGEKVITYKKNYDPQELVRIAKERDAYLKRLESLISLRNSLTGEDISFRHYAEVAFGLHFTQ